MGKQHTNLPCMKDELRSRFFFSQAQKRGQGGAGGAGGYEARRCALSSGTQRVRSEPSQNGSPKRQLETVDGSCGWRFCSLVRFDRQYSESSEGPKVAGRKGSIR